MKNKKNCKMKSKEGKRREHKSRSNSQSTKLLVVVRRTNERRSPLHLQSRRWPNCTLSVFEPWLCAREQRRGASEWRRDNTQHAETGGEPRASGWRTLSNGWSSLLSSMLSSHAFSDELEPDIDCAETNLCCACARVEPAVGRTLCGAPRTKHAHKKRHTRRLGSQV